MTDSDAKPTLLLIDGYGFVFRAFYALPPLTSPKGEPVGAVYGFLKMLLKLLRSQNVTHVAAALDSGARSFRNDVYPDYKAHRPPVPEELKTQFPLIRDCCDALSVKTAELDGFEADDLIASLALRAKKAGMRTIIVSSDKDLMQLVDDDVAMFDPVKNKTIGREEVHEKMGVYPERVRDLLALTGDAADNVPGVPGVGPKTAASLLDVYDNLENLLANAEHIKQTKRRETLLQHRDVARLSYRLVGLDENAANGMELDAFLRAPHDSPALRDFAEKYGFKAILRDMGGDAESLTGASNADRAAPTRCETMDMFVGLAAARAKGEFPTGLTFDLCPGGERVAAISTENGEYYYISANKDEDKALAETVCAMLQDPYCHTMMADAKNALRALYLDFSLSCDSEAVDDVEILSYLCDNGLPCHIDAVAERYGDGALTPPGKNPSAEECALYAAAKARACVASFPALWQKLYDRRLSRVYLRIERPLMATIARMEANGAAIDKEKFSALSIEFSAHVARIEKEIFALAGREFTIGSPKQLGEILFNVMGLKSGKKSGKTGQASTSADVLEELAAGGAEIAQKILDWRHYVKLKNTYVDVLPDMADEHGRVHTYFSMIAANTGRLSSSRPNLQNIPIRTDDGAAIRGAFVATPGHVIVSADYSQIELRLLAHMADIPSLKKAFAEGEDVHAQTARELFGVMPGMEIPADMRRQAKTVNFGVIYGISAFGLATRLRISSKEAKAIIERYFTRYPEIRAYMDKTIAEAKENGCVRTLMGRACPIRDISSSNYALRQFAERAAINAPLQGTAADVIKLAMLEAEKILPDFDGARMALQIHDELLFEVKQDDATRFAVAVKHAMENAFVLSVPLQADVGVGQTWQTAH
ncbi:MAG: DNA polymerase I [Rickettsiales bacterium]